MMSWESPPLDREGFGFNVILDKWLDAIGSRQFGSGSKVIQLDQRWRLGDTIRRMLLAGISCLSRMGLTLLGCATEVSQTVAPTVSYKIGGSVTEPAQGTFTYDAGMVVDLMAEAEAAYQLVRWMGDENTAADIKACSTAIAFC